jgi:membrane-associated protein
MPWPKFLLWNAAGGITWAITVGLLAYFVGNAAISILHTLGYVAAGLVGVGVIALLVWLGLRRRA